MKIRILFLELDSAYDDEQRRFRKGAMDGIKKMAQLYPDAKMAFASRKRTRREIEKIEDECRADGVASEFIHLADPNNDSLHDMAMRVQQCTTVHRAKFVYTYFSKNRQAWSQQHP